MNQSIAPIPAESLDYSTHKRWSKMRLTAASLVTVAGLVIFASGVSIILVTGANPIVQPQINAFDSPKMVEIKAEQFRQINNAAPPSRSGLSEACMAAGGIIVFLGVRALLRIAGDQRIL